MNEPANKQPQATQPEIGPQLRDLLDRHFTQSELESLCFDLSIEYEHLPGETRRKKAEALVRHAERHQRTQALLDQCRQLRPQAAWPDIAPDTAVSPPQPIPTSPDKTPPLSAMVMLLVGVLLLALAGVGINALVGKSGSVTPPPASQSTVTPTAVSPPISSTLPATVPLPSSTPNLPPVSIILAADFAGCDPAVNLSGALQTAVPATIAGDRVVTIQPISSRSAQTARAVAREVGAVAVIWGSCLSAETLVVTVTLTAVTSPYPVTLLQEPPQITLLASPAQAQTLATAAALYALGQYHPARLSLENLARTYQNQPDKTNLTDFFWLWGNILLRLDDWPAAIPAYAHALAASPANRDTEIALLMNKALTSLFAAQGGQQFLACQGQGRADAEKALALAANGRPDLHVLLGQIMLDCPQVDLDIEQAAGEQAALALALDNTFAPAYALQAQIGEENRALADVGDPLWVQARACLAMQHDARLPVAYRVLGRIYARYGLTDAAAALFAAYYQLSPLPWQQRDAAKQLTDLNHLNENLSPPPGFGQCP